MKSALLCANWASLMFAPILVPLRSNCLLRTNSLLFDTIYRCSRTIRNANDLLNKSISFCFAMFSFIWHS